MPDRDQFRRQLQEKGIYASESRGQHFLIDDGYLHTMGSRVISGATVVEVGAGPGNLTEILAARAGKVIAIEIDHKFAPALAEVAERHKNVNIVYGDGVKRIRWEASTINPLRNTQIIANLPYHITEPFLTQTIDLKMVDMTLMLGEEAADAIDRDPRSDRFGKMSLLTQTFFDAHVVTSVPSRAFDPEPATDSAIVSFTPKSKREIASSTSNAIFAQLFRGQGKSGLVVNEIKQVLSNTQTGGKYLDKRDSHQRDRSATRQTLRQMQKTGNYNEIGDERHGTAVISQSYALQKIEQMGISQDILQRPFSRLDNQDIRMLTQAVRGYFG